MLHNKRMPTDSGELKLDSATDARRYVAYNGFTRTNNG